MVGRTGVLGQFTPNELKTSSQFSGFVLFAAKAFNYAASFAVGKSQFLRGFPRMPHPL